MKWISVVVAAFVIYFAVGIAQIFVNGKKDRLETIGNKARVSRCLGQIFNNLESIKASNGQFPETLTADMIPDEFTLNPTDFIYSPKARDLDPLVQYKGAESGASGLKVLASGLVTRNAVVMEDDRAAEQPTQDD